MQHQSGIKILNGMIILTRRTYRIYLVAVILLTICVWISVNTILGPSSDFGRNVMVEFPLFYTCINWALVVGVFIQIFEIIYINQKFREREEFLQRERGEQRNG